MEFFSNGDASAAVNKCNTRGHQLRLGDRAVDVELSSQDELLKQLFPRAKNVVWEGGVPIIEASDEPFNTGFKSFVTGEEMVMVVRHAEQPHRVSSSAASTPSWPIILLLRLHNPSSYALY